MTAAIVSSMAYALILTLLLETLFAVICGVKGKRDYIIIILVNIMTNPLVNFIYDFCVYRLGGTGLIAVTAVLEISAVTAEWLVYRHRTDISRPFLFSLGANGFSFFSGMLIGILKEFIL